MTHARALLVSAYGRLARLHPRPFRDTFALEMQAVFASLIAATPGRRGLALLCMRELAGLLASIGREHWETTMRTHTRGQRLALAAGAVYALGIALLALALHQASPGPADQEVLGLAIGSYDGDGGIVYMSGRRLSCAPVTADAGARCTVEIAGETLELHARRNGPESPLQLAGTCSARYAGREWPCSIGSRHVHVHWFAYLPEPLGLSPEQLDTLRRQHPLENLPEPAFLQGLLLVPLLTALLATGGIALWRWGSPRRGRTVALSTLAGAVGGVGSLLLTLMLTGGFWD